MQSTLPAFSKPGSFEHFGGIVRRRKDAPLFKMVVEVRRIRCEHDVTASSFHTNALQTLGATPTLWTVIPGAIASAPS